jgi:hypothetical protein
LPRHRLANDEFWFRGIFGVEDVGELDAAVEEEEAAAAVCDLPATVGTAGRKSRGNWLLPLVVNCDGMKT